jgi:hypothetical protein
VDGYQHLVVAIEALLFRHDPIGINFGSNTDEYRAEAQTIVPRLRSASDEDAVLQIVHEEFVTWFGVAGPMQSYRPIAADIWRLLSE